MEAQSFFFARAEAEATGTGGGDWHPFTGGCSFFAERKRRESMRWERWKERNVARV